MPPESQQRTQAALSAPEARGAVYQPVIDEWPVNRQERGVPQNLGEVAVGTIIADRPTHRSAIALTSACGSYLGWVEHARTGGLLSLFPPATPELVQWASQDWQTSSMPS
jgi:hypothetical protein